MIIRLEADNLLLLRDSQQTNEMLLVIHIVDTNTLYYS